MTSDEKVIVAPGISCGLCRYCRSGWNSLCPEFKIVGYQTQGGYAEYAAVPSGNLLPIPDKLTCEEAASVPLVFLTAWHMLRTRAGLKPGENVLVWECPERDHVLDDSNLVHVPIRGVVGYVA